MSKNNSSNGVLIAPSILSCDFSRVGEEIRDVEKAGCDWIHLDVMDGCFVPNLTIGPPVIRWIRKITQLPLDTHLMIDDPIRYVDDYRKAGSDWITFHAEAVPDIRAVIKKIKDSGAKVGMSIKPTTPAQILDEYLDGLDLILVMTVEPGFGGQSFMPDMVDKVRYLRSKFKGRISVDGGIQSGTAGICVAAGADVLVAGTSVFGAPDRKKAIEALRLS